jgi:hypothetical protein
MIKPSEMTGDQRLLCIERRLRINAHLMLQVGCRICDKLGDKTETGDPMHWRAKAYLYWYYAGLVRQVRGLPEWHWNAGAIRKE